MSRDYETPEERCAEALDDLTSQAEGIRDHVDWFVGHARLALDAIAACSILARLDLAVAEAGLTSVAKREETAAAQEDARKQLGKMLSDFATRSVDEG